MGNSSYITFGNRVYTAIFPKKIEQKSTQRNIQEVVEKITAPILPTVLDFKVMAGVSGSRILPAPFGSDKIGSRFTYVTSDIPVDFLFNRLSHTLSGGPGIAPGDYTVTDTNSLLSSTQLVKIIVDSTMKQMT